MLLKKDRLLHMYGVAELMANNYELFKCSNLTKTEVYFLGLNHDIGFIEKTDTPEIIGAQIVNSNNAFINDVIKWHSHTPYEYIESKKITEKEIPNELILLWWSDLQIESQGTMAGNRVNFAIRLKNIETRYGKDSKEYKNSKIIIDWLKQKLEIYNDFE